MKRTIIGAGYAGVITTCVFLACGGSTTGGGSGSGGTGGGGSGNTSSGGGSGNATSGSTTSGSATSGTFATTGFGGSGFLNPDAGFSFDAFAFPDGFFGTPSGACAQLASCCNASTNGLVKFSCTLLASTNDQPTCQQTLAALQDGGQCH